jgi:hypothetical protein
VREVKEMRTQSELKRGLRHGGEIRGDQIIGLLLDIRELLRKDKE